MLNYKIYKRWALILGKGSAITEKKILKKKENLEKLIEEKRFQKMKEMISQYLIQKKDGKMKYNYFFLFLKRKFFYFKN